MKPALGVRSPCIEVCRIDEITQCCEGCLRTLDEIAAWPRLDEPGKRAIWLRIEARRACVAGEALPPP